MRIHKRVNASQNFNEKGTAVPVITSGHLFLNKFLFRRLLSR
ncbi:hypothetical protein HMPREF3038_00894 [Akkermansia sp. KLE1797]|nr:hypothetical protein HMPREF3038_00894 [Akkermansia sp. KLE1797]